MWLFSKQGFVSIVQCRHVPGQLLVRARVKTDLDHFLGVVEQLGGSLHTIEETPTADYRFRSVVKREHVAQVVAMLASDIDYPNFKNSVHGDWKRDETYMQVWAAMRDLQTIVSVPRTTGEHDGAAGA